MDATAEGILGYVAVGHGPRHVMVLHGWFGDSMVYEPMLPYLDSDAATYVFADFRGYGRSRDLAGQYTIDEMVGDLVALADTLGWPRFDVIGHSMGGKVAQVLAARHPTRIRCAIGLTPVPASRLDVDVATWKLFERAVENDKYRHALVHYSTGCFLPERWVNEIVWHSRRTCDASVFGAYLMSWARDDLTADVRGCTVPMLLLVGRNDPAQTPQAMRGTCMEWFANARVAVLEGCGHYPMQEIPIRLARVIEDFLGEH